MFGVQNEENLQSSHKFWVRDELILIQLIHHVQEILNISHVS